MSRLLVAASSGFIGGNITAALGDLGPTSVPSETFRSGDPDSLKFFLQQHDDFSLILPVGRGSGTTAKGLTGDERTFFFNKIWSARAELLRADRVIWFGSSAEYGRAEAPAVESQFPAPDSTYGLGKVLETRAWLMLREMGVRVTVLRPSTVYGPGQAGSMLIPSIVLAARRREAVRLSCPNSLRDFLHVSDLTKALRRILVSKEVLPPVMNLGSGFVYSPAQVASFFEVPRESGGCDGPLSGNREKCYNVLIDSGLARNVLNWRAEIDLRLVAGGLV